MKSLILQNSTKYLKILMLIFSVVLLWRGHNEPGGGFAGGLLAASAFILYWMAYDVRDARKALFFSPQTLIGLGLLFTLSAGALGLWKKQPFLTGSWIEFDIPLLGHLSLGTPLLFDLGVYCVVLGVVLLVIFTLVEEDPNILTEEN